MEPYKNWKYCDDKMEIRMDYYNKTLQEELQENLTIDNKISLIEQIATNVIVFWNIGLFYTDIKPSNILLDKKGKIVMVDLGSMSSTGPITKGYVRKKNR